MDFTFSKQLNYLVHHAEGEYVAHCLDMDLVGTGQDQDEAIAELNTAVRALVYFALKTETFDILSLCKEAPTRYWDMFDEAKKTSGTITRELEVSPELAPVTVKQCHFTYCFAVAA
jgi:hypothetical protein